MKLNKLMSVVLGLALIQLIFTQPAFARSRANKKADTASTETYNPDRDVASTGGSKFWVGPALDSAVTDNVSTPALSMLITLNDKMAIQAYAGVYGVNPFLFAVGGDFKYTLVGDVTKGLHIGGGVGLGEVGGNIQGNIGGININAGGSAFFVNINGLVGIHFQIVDNVLVNLDSGATVSISNGNTNFALAGHPAFGASILYHI